MTMIIDFLNHTPKSLNGISITALIGGIITSEGELGKTAKLAERSCTNGWPQ